MYVRYGYRRLAVLLRREGWHVNAKRIYRLYREEELIVRAKQRRKMARRQRTMTADVAVRPNQRWSMDFVSDKLADGRSFRILTVVDQFTPRAAVASVRPVACFSSLVVRRSDAVLETCGLWLGEVLASREP